MIQKRGRIICFYAIYLGILLLFLYLILVFGDYLLGKWISQHNESEVTKAELIERERISHADIPEREAALKDGYKPLFYPETIDNYRPLKKLSERLGVAPIAPQPNSKLYFCNEGYGLIKYKSDRFGFRNTDKLWDDKIDVVVIGDSFTHGACVKDEETISGNLSNQFNVLNLGSYGNHAIHYAAIEKTFIPLVKPKSAITIFYANDNEDDMESVIWDRYFHNEPNYFSLVNGKKELSSDMSNFYIQAEYLIQQLLSGEGSPDEFIKSYAPPSLLEKISKYLSLPTIRKSFDNYLKVKGLKNTLPKSNILAIDILISSCKQVGCKPIVAYIPNSDFWRPDPRSANYLKLLTEYCNQKDVLFLDGSPSIYGLGNEAYASKGPHLSPAGYAAISKMLQAGIQATKPTSSAR